MMRLGPVWRLSIGLVMLTVGIILTGDALRLVPDNQAASALDGRRKVAEALGIQFAHALTEGNLSLVEVTLRAVVQRNDDVLSAALSREDGSVAALAGDHQRYWRSVIDGRSTATHTQVPIYTDSARWGTLQLAFTPVHEHRVLGIPLSPLVMLTVFVAVVGLIVYALFLRRSLRAIDPAAVVPSRVQTALDALTEGVVFLDTRGNVVLANASFIGLVGTPEHALLGRPLAELDWCLPNSQEPALALPWTATGRDGTPSTGVALELVGDDGRSRSFSINSSPVSDDRGAVQGVLVTFDDITEIEEKNRKLNDAMTMLRTAQSEIEGHNEQLRILAERDGLTGLLNRRTLMEKLDGHFDEARAAGTPLTCIMLDIDHFKSVNDVYGHLTGDRAITFVANVIKHGARHLDLLGRYGGEEFCVVLPDTDAEEARRIAERMRAHVEAECSRAVQLTDGRTITASFGIAARSGSMVEAAELLQRADEALYRSKENGRNTVTIWSAHDERNARIA